MINKIIRGAGFLALCLAVAVMPVKAAEDPVSLSKDGDGVKVELSKEAIADEVHSLHLSFDVDVTKGSLAESEVSFDWAISDDAYKTQFCEKKDGGLTLDIYTSAKEDLFSSGNDGLTLGVIKLTPAKGSVTANVAVTGSLETVNGVQEMNKAEGAKTPSVEVTARKNSSGGKKPGSSSSSSSNNNTNSGSNNGQTAKNNNNANANNVNNNLGFNNNINIVQATPDTDTVQDSVTNQNKKGQTSRNRTVQKDNASNSESDAESAITGMQLSESEEVETEQEPMSEIGAVSTVDADDGSESEESYYRQGEYEVEVSDTPLGIKVLVGVIIAAVVGVGIFFVVKNKS